MRLSFTLPAVLLLSLAGIACGNTESVSEASRAAELSRLVPCDRALCTSDGARFRWRGVTAFALADLIADGHQPQARAFVEWAARTKFNTLRVLATNHGWIELSPEDGRRALPRLFALAREYGLYVQVVALAGTREGPLATEEARREQVRQVGALCAAASNCVLELANEPYHGTQASLENPDVMRRLQQEVPPDVPVAWGAANEDASDVMAGGSFVVAHVGRNGPRWTRVARARELLTLSARVGKFVVDNEAIGAAERAERNRRDDAPGAFFAQGLLSRLFEIGSTFHCEDCLRARVPGPTQQACAKAFIEGAMLMPDSVNVGYTEPGSPEAPIAAVNSPDTHPFAGISGSQGWVVVLGGDAAPELRWQNGWRATKQTQPYPGVYVWEAAQRR
jgi:hypothetical protein